MRRVRAGFAWLLPLALTLLFLLPLFWAGVNSLGAVDAPPPRTVVWWPADPRWDNYAMLFELLPVGRYLRNSLLVVAGAVPLTVLTASAAGFGMAQLDEPAYRRLLLFSVAVLMVPGASVWIARFQILRWLGLLDTLWALIAPAFAASSPLFVLLYTWNFRRIPAELFEAAWLEGISARAAWWRLAMPLARPTTVAVIVLTVVLYWSDFVSPVLYLYDPGRYTLPVGLQVLKQLDPTAWPLLMAGAVLMTLPVIALFILLHRFFLSDHSLAALFERN